MNRSNLFLALALTVTAGAYATPAHAGFSLRAGADVRPLVFAGDPSGTIADQGYLGITAAPGYKLIEVLTLELGLTAMIPLVGSPPFNFLITPGAIFDLYIVYLRGGFPISINEGGARLWMEAAAGISFLTKGYLGLFIDYIPADAVMYLGAEVGWRFP